MGNITPKEVSELQLEFGSQISRLITKMIPAIKATYADIFLIDLLMALPIKFEFTEFDISAFKPNDAGQLPTLESRAVSGYITRDTDNGNPDRLVVFLDFHKDISMTWKEYFDWVVNTPNVISQAAFTYLHEALHILNRHYDYYLNQKYESIIQSVRTDLNQDERDELLNHAFDYWMNAYLIEKASYGSVIGQFKNGVNFSALYDPSLSPELMTQQEIVRKLAKEAEIKREEICFENQCIGHQVSITINGRTSSTFYPIAQHGINQDRSETSHEQEIGEVLDSTRQQLLDRTMGSGSQGTLKNLGVSYEVPVDWFASLKSSIFTIVQRYTNQSDQTWSKLKNKFRHVATLPGRIFYDKQLAAVISIDQSGSMSDDDLRKINYVVGELAKKAQFVEVLLHDTSVVSRKKFIGHKKMEITEFVTKRVAFGGTSHKEVFEILAKIQEENPKTKLIYMSFSDNYSDIEQVYSADLFRKIIPYWITTVESNPTRVPGMQISLENGLLQA